MLWWSGLNMRALSAALRWLYTPANALPVCLAAGFLLPSTAAWSTFFYVIALPTMLLRIGQGWRPDWSDRPAMAMLALWGWSSLTILWELNNSHHGDGHIYWLLHSVSTLALLLCFFMAAQDEPATRERVVTTIVWCGAVASALSVFLHIVCHAWPGRLGGWGALHMPVLGAAVDVVCILLTLNRLAIGRIYYLAAMLPLLVYLPLNGSRTALLALACALLVVATSSRRTFYYLICCALSVLALCGAIYALHFGWVDEFIKAAMARGTDCHVTIWRTAWGLFLQRPIFGYGPSARLPILPHGACPAYPSPHNLYLSLLVYSGVIGFALFWVCEAVVLRHLLRLRASLSRRFGLAIMLVPLITGLSDLTQVIKGPSALWYIIWLPLLLVVSLPDSAPELSGRFPASSGLPPRG